MHQFTHAWLAFMAIKRLEKRILDLPARERKYVTSLIDWFQKNKDCVIQGAWYPDQVIRDNGTSHILKIEPYDEARKDYFAKEVKASRMKIVQKEGFRRLPKEYLCYIRWGKSSARRRQPFVVELKTNLPDRCESFTQSAIDHFKIQWQEQKGSPVAPTSNQLAHLFFMQSHYIADAHVPFHCDGRSFSQGKNMHGDVEDAWEEKVLASLKRDMTDENNPRFIYDEEGYPAVRTQAFKGLYLEKAHDEIIGRKLGKINSFFATGNNNVWDFMNAVCQNSYIISFDFFPPADFPDPLKASFRTWKNNHKTEFEELSAAVLADAADSIARVWLRIWRRYEDWVEKRILAEEEEKEKEKKKAGKNKQPVNP